MLKFFVLILKNVGRHKGRTALTACAVMVLVTVSAQMAAVLAGVRDHLEAEGSQSKLLVSERWVWPSQVPVRHVAALSRLPGVTDWTTWNLYAGSYDGTAARQEAWGLATRVENLREMNLGLSKLSPAVVEALRRERTGAIMSAGLMEVMHWQVGDRFTVRSVSHPQKDLRFKIVGALPPGEFPQNFFFRQDYFEEGTGQRDTVTNVWLRLASPEAAQAVAARIEQDFGRRQPELRVETESAGLARFVSRNHSMLSFIRLVVVVLAGDMVLLLSNSISLATRERRSEMAVLKVLGFRPRAIVGLVVGEASLVGLASGLLGAGLACLASALAARGLLPGMGLARIVLAFPVHPAALWWGGALGALVGAAGSVLPAWGACRVKVCDVFARVA